MFGGKGGVGKTTVSAALALKMAENGNRVLVISSDPAHSTSDSFDAQLSDTPTKIVDGLYGVEIDPSKRLRELVPILRDVIKQPLRAMGLEDLDFTSDEMMFPGLDEALAFDQLLRYVESTDYDLVIFDTAPTGHTLRFLSLPELMDTWLAKLIKMKAKLQNLKAFFTGGERTGFEEIELLKRRVGHIRRILADPALTSFYIVLIPEMMALEETRRAMKILGQYRIPVSGLVVNNIFPPEGSCEMCLSRRKVQDTYLVDIRGMGLPVTEIPLQTREVRGLDRLRDIGEYTQLRIETIRSLETREEGGEFKVSLYYPGATEDDLLLRKADGKLVIELNQVPVSAVDVPFYFEIGQARARLKGDRLTISVRR